MKKLMSLCAMLVSVQVYGLVVVDNQGNVTTLWTDNTNIYSATKTSSGAWSTSATISDSSTRSFNPQLYINSTGDVVAIWCATNLTSLTNALIIAQKPQGGSWSSLTQISSSTENILGNYSLSFDTSYMAATWNANLNNVTVERGASGVFGGSWSTPTTLFQY